MMRSREELRQHLEHIRQSPATAGTLVLVVRRPVVDEREVVPEAELDVDEGLIGDRWAEHAPDPERQVTLMNVRAAEAVAGAIDRWPLAGDQLFVDFDLSRANVPAGTQLLIGDVALEISEVPHTGCRKCAARFGDEALRWVNEPDGRALGLRGVNARVMRGGHVRTGDRVLKLG